MKFSPLAFFIVFSALSPACRKDPPERNLETLSLSMKTEIQKELKAWEEASRALVDAAPTPADRGWDDEQDRQAIEKMRRAWFEARRSYELIEGAIAPIFPESDAATDSRYDDFLSHIGPQGDPDPFDDDGIIGMHAIERILWANEIPEEVVRFERGLPGYRSARYPETAEEALAFKEKLAARLVRDIQALRAQFEPLILDPAFVYQGLIDLAMEQTEKVDRAATGQEESRYAQATMRDLRSNYEGCLKAYQVFQPELRQKKGGAELDARVLAAFARLEAAYSKVEGDSIPQPPMTWSTVSPNLAHRETPFGELYFRVKRESDPTLAGSLVSELSQVARVLELRGVIVN